MTALAWLVVEREGRAVRLTVEGRQALRERLGVELDAEGLRAA
jgi:hypothetical protein